MASAAPPGVSGSPGPADPVISIGLGVLWLGVALRSSPAENFGQGRVAAGDDLPADCQRMSPAWCAACISGSAPATMPGTA
jgi:hypothetical protein